MRQTLLIRPGGPKIGLQGPFRNVSERNNETRHSREMLGGGWYAERALQQQEEKIAAEAFLRYIEDIYERDDQGPLKRKFAA